MAAVVTAARIRPGASFNLIVSTSYGVVKN
jgi:hypothetical protein